jgi:murein DD-endopeptidase MepM/ murein hydrolase activator NlpD
LDHSKRRSAYAAVVDADAIDLGHEPPLSVDGEAGGLVDRRQVSVQWFSGTILTGLCGAALMGGAVFASLGGDTNFATVPERVGAALRGAIGALSDRLGASPRKSDRLPAAGEVNSQRQVIRVTQTTRGANNREIVRVRPFVRVAGNLSLTVTELSADIPAFNPQKMLLAEATATPGVTPAEDAPDTEIDAEVTFLTRDLGPALPRAKIAALVPIEEVIASVRSLANWNAGPTARYAAESMAPDRRLSYAPAGGNDPYAGFGTRIAPENITLVAKTATQTNGGNAWTERSIALKKTDSVAAVLRDLGGKPEEIKAIAAALGPRARDGSIKDGQKLRVLLAATADGKRSQPMRVVLAGDAGTEAIVALSDLGKYVAVDVRSIETEVAQVREEEEDDGKGVRLHQSIYETALRNQVPRPLIDELIRIYSYDIDFQRKVQPGDSFEILYAGEDESPDAKGDVLFASLTTGGETKKFYRYQSVDDGVVDYYDETGKSAKKFLVRKPLGEGIVRSGFGARHHPLLQFTKMHTGVDWASPMGTPIYASGNGTVDKIGWEGGYGKYIRIRHAIGYETAYGHMSAFARGMDVGKKVRQGQVIGYVGSTGLSTGAHLHYEILVNGRFVDPMRIRLPRGRVLEGTLLAGFEQERDRLDNMMTRAAPPQRPAAAARIAQTTATSR